MVNHVFNVLVLFPTRADLLLFGGAVLNPEKNKKWKSSELRKNANEIISHCLMALKYFFLLFHPIDFVKKTLSNGTSCCFQKPAGWPGAGEGRISLFVLSDHACSVYRHSTHKLVRNVSFLMLTKPLIECKLIPWLPRNPRHPRRHEKFIAYQFQPVEKSLWGLRSAWIPPALELNLIASCLCMCRDRRTDRCASKLYLGCLAQASPLACLLCSVLGASLKVYGERQLNVGSGPADGDMQSPGADGYGANGVSSPTKGRNCAVLMVPW